MKNKKVEKFLDINTTGEQLDHLMKEIIEEKFDKELKSKYAKILNDDLDVQRSAKLKKLKSRRYYRVASILIILVGVALAAYFVLNQFGKGEDGVQQYLAQNQLLYQGANRNDTAVISQNKSNAYQAFNQGNYSEFLELLSVETIISNEDRFFMAYATMMEADYEVALEGFEAFSQNLLPEQKYYQEANLYKAICLLKTNKIKFDEYFNSLESDSWVRNELNKIDSLR